MDKLRQVKGKNYQNLFNGYADGGEVRNNLGTVSISGSPQNAPASSASGFSGNISVENNIYQNESGARIETDIYLETPSGKKKIESIVEDVIYQNGRDGKIPFALDRVKK